MLGADRDAVDQHLRREVDEGGDTVPSDVDAVRERAGGGMSPARPAVCAREGGRGHGEGAGGMGMGMGMGMDMGSVRGS